MTGTARLHITPLVEADVDALAELLWDERVYAYIGGLPASADRIALGLRRALAGPTPDRPPQQWLNYGMRLREDGTLIGRLEASMHENGIAEVAYLLAPRFWGHGYAREGLLWLHEELARVRHRPDGLVVFDENLPHHVGDGALHRLPGVAIPSGEEARAGREQQVVTDAVHGGQRAGAGQRARGARPRLPDKTAQPMCACACVRARACVCVCVCVT